MVEKIDLALASDDHPLDLEYRLIRPDGSIRFVHESAEVIRDEKGKAVRMVGITQDIT
jgi:PAS domain S-box-containing protein